MARTCSANLAENLGDELAAIESKIACLTKGRDTVREFLVRTQHAAVLGDLSGVLADSVARSSTTDRR